METIDSILREKSRCGGFTILDEAADFKVKRIEVLPQKRLSYQKRRQRAENRFVVAETATILWTQVKRL